MENKIIFSVEGYETLTTIQHDRDDLTTDEAFNSCIVLLRALGFSEDQIQEEINDRVKNWNK